MATTAEYGLGEFTYPRGWFMVGISDDVVPGKPHSVRYFGEDMVLYRGQSGRAFLVEAYCPHMGTHLAKNSTSYVVQDEGYMEGDNIRCPYHGWRFGPDGRCNEIPYSPAPIPKAACIKSWPVQEKAGCIWMWYDPEGGAADYELPDFQGYDEPHWVNWQPELLGDLACHPQEIVDNMSDKAHLEPVHGSIDMVLFENEFNDHTCRQILTAGHKTLAGAGAEPMTNDTWYTGPAILQSIMVGEYPSLMLITHTPIDDGVVKVWYALAVKVANENPDAGDREAAQGYHKAGVAAFAQDFEIWGNKRACINPMMVKGDGPFHKVRIWYKQFYNPRARAAEFQKRVNGHIVTQGTERDPWPEADVA